MDNLTEVLKYLDPKKPLSGNDLKFYVQRDDNIFRQFQIALEQDENSKILFTGMIGSGKSTELNFLKERFSGIVLKPNIEEEIRNLFELDINKLLSYIFLTFLKVIIEGIQNPTTIKQIDSLLKLSYSTIDSRHDTSYEVLYNFTKNNYTFNLIEKDYPEFFRIFNLLKNELYPNNSPVLILDGLDKLSDDFALDLFYLRGDLFQQIPLKIIFTVPFTIFFDDKFSTKQRDIYTESILLPALYVPLGVSKQFKSVIDNRMRLSHVPINRGIEARLIRFSGGLFRHLIILLRETVKSTIIRGGDDIKIDDFQNALQNLEDDFERTLTNDDYKMLENFQQKNKWSSDYKILLRKQAVLFYKTQKSMYRIHPIVKKILNIQEAKL